MGCISPRNGGWLRQMSTMPGGSALLKERMWTTVFQVCAAGELRVLWEGELCSGDVDQDADSVDTHCQLRLDDARRNLALTIANVKLPAMPGAGDDAAVQPAFSQRTALVGADAVEGEELAVDIVQRHNPVAGDAFQGRTGRAFVDRRHGDPTVGPGRVGRPRRR